MPTIALITGISGQDGSYLAELLLENGYQVHGIVRQEELDDPDTKLQNILPIVDRIELHTASLESLSDLENVLKKVKPDQCYHLAAQSFVAHCSDDEILTMKINVNGTHHMLAAVKETVPGCGFFFAASSEMFGNAQISPQNEGTFFCPRSIYGISKLAGFELTRYYRQAYGLKAWSGILYNHESPRRAEQFVTRKITSQAAKIKLGLDDKLVLGNLDARRDWGYAKEYVRAMRLMLEQDEPSDYVIATGKAYSVREFLEKTFNYLELDYRDYVTVDEKFVRPSESILLTGDSTKAKKKLGWEYECDLDSLIKIMVDHDLEVLTNK